MSIPSVTTDYKNSDPEINPKNCSTWCGRVIRKALEVGTTLFKVVAVAGFFFTPALASGLNHTYFPNYLARFNRPAEQKARMYSTACCDATLYTAEFCQKITTDIVHAGVTQKLIQLDSVGTEIGAATRGFVENKIRSVKILIDPRFGLNYEKTIAYIERSFLRSPFTPFEENPTAIIQYILKLHSLLLENVPNKEIILPGQFRRGSKYLASPILLPYFRSQAERVLTQMERERFYDMAKLLEGTGGLQITNEEEKAIWRKVGLHVAPHYMQIPNRMQNLAEEIFNKISQKEDPIDIAAYIHVELADISPFNSMVGKLARLLVNAVLRRYGGHAPLIFFRESEYVNAISRAVAQKDYVLFANYLRDELKWTKEHINTLLYTPLSSTKAYPENLALYMHTGIKLSPDGRTGKVYAKESSSCEHDTYNPQELVNFKNAFRAVTERILQKPNALIESESKIIEDMQYIHSKLAHNMDPLAGNFRRERKIVYTSYMHSDAKNKLTDVDFELYNKSHQEIIIRNELRHFTEEELLAWHRAGAHIATLPEEVAAEMQKLAEELIFLLTKENDYIYIASYVHTHIVRIHPFNKYTGKFARLYLSAILTRYMGIERPVLFVEDKRYVEMCTRAVRGDIIGFSHWLRDEILPAQNELYKKINAL